MCKFQSFWRRSVPPKVLCCAYRELLPWNFWHIRFHPVVRLGTWMYKILRNYKISRHDDPSQKPFKKSPKIPWENTYSDEYLFAPIPFKFSISLKEWMNLFSPEMTVDKNAGKQTRASKRKKCFYQSSKKSCPLKAWFFGARKVQSSIIQSDKNHFEESRERGLIWVVYYNPWPCCDVLQEK